jgi:ABC-2 type transport system ATP-binding protein
VLNSVAIAPEESPALLRDHGQDVVQLRHVHKSYGAVHAVDGITFGVRRGEVFGVLGPNGAGKTTTLEMIEGMLPLDRGSITVNGVDVTQQPQRVRRMVGIALQKSDFFERLTLVELIRLFGGLYGVRTDSRALLQRVGLEGLGGRQVKTLSGGQQQRFAVAVALVNDPPLLLLDEPTTGLDPQARHHVWDLVLSLRLEGRSIVLTTHYMEEAEELCDRVAILDQGRVLALDAPRNLVRQLVESGFQKRVQVQPANLEDVFLHMTGRRLREE